MSVAKPFTLLGETVEKVLITRLNTWLCDLYSGWFSDADKFSFSVNNKNKTLQIDSNVWEVYGNSQDYWVAFKKDINTKNKVMSEIFELDLHADLKATKFTEAIFQDFIDSNVNSIFELTNSVNLKTQGIQNFNAYFGSGAVTGTLGNGKVSLPIALGGGLVKAICGESNKKLKDLKPTFDLVSREGAIGRLKSKVDVSAGKVKISLADFSKMEVGDVVVLDTRVGNPFAVSLSSNATLHVQLGNRINKKAIQLVE